MAQNKPTDSKPDCFIYHLEHSGVTEHFLTIVPESDVSPASMFERMDACLLELGSPCVLRMEILGQVNTMGTESLQQKYCYNCSECALNHTNENAQGECPVAGVYVHAVSGGSIRPIWLGGRLSGNVFEDRYVR